jgi:hypothetical protein
MLEGGAGGGKTIIVGLLKLGIKVLHKWLKKPPKLKPPPPKPAAPKPALKPTEAPKPPKVEPPTPPQKVMTPKLPAAGGAGKTVLGKFPDYVNLADDLAARRFSIPTKIWNKMTPAQQWAANQKLLDRMITRGDEIILSNPIKNVSEATGWFGRELNYLVERGFRLSSDGTRMIR